MILVYGRADDPPTRQTLDALQASNVPLVFVEQRALQYERIHIAVTAAGMVGELSIGGQIIPLEQVRAVFARPLEPSTRGLESGVCKHVVRLHNLLMDWLDSSPITVVNRPRAMQANASKPFQLQAIGASGLKVPATLVTSDKEEALSFWQMHGRVIYKSISGIRSIVRELDAQSAKRLSLIARLPVQFQELVSGVDVRVHVVGDECFSCCIDSPVIDYRYAHLQGADADLRSIELPAEVSAQCISLAKAMELPLAGIDFRVTPDNEYFCLEVNPMPAYTFFANRADLPISEAIAKLLITSAVS